jgi:hypothetical protein
MYLLRNFGSPPPRFGLSKEFYGLSRASKRPGLSHAFDSEFAPIGHRIPSGDPAIVSGHLLANLLQIANGLIQYRIGFPNRRNEFGGPIEIQLNAGQAVAAFLSIERSMYGLGTGLIWFAAEQARDLVIRHPNLRHRPISINQ